MIDFYKFEGTGNDFILLMEHDIEGIDASKLAVQICDRHFGVGADGMMVVRASSVANVRMDFYNADGSVASMCGNGIRCFAKYVCDRGLVKDSIFTVETLAGVLTIKMVQQEAHESFVRVNLGQPLFKSDVVPVAEHGDEFLNIPICIDKKVYNLNSLFIGTIHTVIFVDDFSEIQIEVLGDKIEHLPLFPIKTNVNFCKVMSPDLIEVKTWEKGVGLTLACGTGAAASAIVTTKLHQGEWLQHVKVSGGLLKIEQLNDGIYLTGPAKMVCQGRYFFSGSE